MTAPTEVDRTLYIVVHPLDDEPEKKLETDNLGPMRITMTVRVCLYALRAYLLAMFGMLGYRVLELAGIIRG